MCCFKNKYLNELGQFLDMTNDDISSPASKKQKKGNKKQEPESKTEVHELAAWDFATYLTRCTIFCGDYDWSRLQSG